MHIVIGLFCVFVTVTLSDAYAIDKPPINTLTLLKRDGYKYENHTVITEDDYILRLYRIPSTTGNKNPKVVFLNHGFVTGGFEWVLRGSNHSLGYLLADAGYDVWITNNRANSDSPIEHRWPGKFWDFSLDDLGNKDTPNAIDYILNVTGQTNVTYIAHSQGALFYFIMCLENPEYEAKVNVYIGLAPLYTMKHASNILSLIFDNFLYNRRNSVLNLNAGAIINAITQAFCVFSSRACWFGYLYLSGLSYNETTVTDVKYIRRMYPDGVSLQNMNQILQWLNKDYIHKFDYGVRKNRIKYGAEHPPIYNLTAVTRAPKYIFYGSLDVAVRPKGVEFALPSLRNVKGAYKIPGYGHIDFTRARSVKSKINDRILDILGQY